VKLAEAYGHVGMRVESKEELRPAMEKAFALKDRLVFMDIVVDPHEHVYPMHIAPGCMRDMWLSKTERT
jgi:acetolactate synthase-1/2/3 large subunit